MVDADAGGLSGDARGFLSDLVGQGAHADGADPIRTVHVER
jgi:hypothetical protein